MKKTFFVLLILFTSAVVFAGTLSGMEISGTVWTIPTKEDDKASEKVALKPAPGVVVKAVSIEGASLAEGKTDDKGVYRIQLPEGRETRVLSAEMDGGPIRTILFGKTNDIDPVTEALTWKIISADPANYTSAEFELMTKELRILADRIGYPEGATAIGAMDYMIDVPDFNIALTDLAATYGASGDSVAITDEVKSAVESFVKAFNFNDAQKIKDILVESPEIFIDGSVIKNADEVVGKIRELHKMFGDITLDVSFAALSANDNKALALTYERIRMSNLNGENQNIDESWISKNELVRKNGKWIISKRGMMDCVVVKSAIETDGRLNDWAGISPCYRKSADSPETDGITAMFFARDDKFLYWRMDLNMLTRVPLAGEPSKLGVPRGEFYVHFYGNEDNQNCDNLINVVNNDLTSAASGVRICARDEKGEEKDSTHSHNKFAVGSRFIEGSVLLEDIFFLKDELFSFAKGKRRLRPGAPEEPFFTTNRIKLVF